jgi:hypothetical protein
MANRNVYHVQPNGDNWEGKLESAGRASVSGESKSEVQERTIEIAKNNQPSSVIIHGRDGKVQEERTYPRSSDPNPPKG